MGPAIREKQAKEEVDAGKQQAAEEGTQSVFEAISTPVRPKSVSKRTPTLGVSGIRKPAKPRPTSVCSLVWLHMSLINGYTSSTNIQPPTSRFLIAN